MTDDEVRSRLKHLRSSAVAVSMQSMANPPIVAVGVVAAALVVTAISTKDRQARAPACSVALALLQERYSHTPNMAVSEEPIVRAPTADAFQDFLKRNPQFKSDPDVPIVRREIEVRDLSPLRQCSDVRSWLRNQNILHDDKKIGPLGSDEDGRQLTVITLSMPVILEERAFLYVGSACGDGCGSTMHVELKRRPGGGWMIVREQEMGIS